MSSFDKAEFIGWDSEGINDGFIDQWTERQKLVLISVSSGETLYDDAGIEQERRLQFIADVARAHPNAVHVFFGGSYDFNKIIEGMPPKKLTELHTSKFWTHWNRWAFRYRPRKELTIAHLRQSQFNYKRALRAQCDAYIRFWDVIGFFQAPFITVVKQWLGEGYADYELIASGKQARLAFSVDDREFMIRYNAAETRALSAIMNILHEQLRKLGLRIPRWDGAGAIAAEIFKRYQLTRAYYAAQKQKIELPNPVEEATRFAYFGGRIESAYIGRAGGAIYNYDINSAYPYAASLLPNMNGGKWEHFDAVSHDDAMTMGRMAIYRVQWYFHEDRPYYPFPYRCHDGGVLFPKIGERWIYSPEVIAALMNKRATDQIHIRECWRFTPDENAENPWPVIRELYSERQKLLAKKDPAEKVLKLAINALYGKLCQRLGYDEKNKRSPRYHFLLFAGWITSFIRGMIYRTIAPYMNDVIAINTDGVVSLRAIPNIWVSKTKELGAWTLDLQDDIVQLQSGVYWIRKGEMWKERARGLGRVVGEGDTEAAREFDRNQKIRDRIAMVENGWDIGIPKVYFPVKLFITSKKSLIGPDWNRRHGHWYTMHDERPVECDRLHSMSAFKCAGFIGRGVDLKFSGWGKRRLNQKLKSGQLTPTVASENLEWGGKLGIDNVATRDLGAVYSLPWVTKGQFDDLDDDGDIAVG